MKRINPLHIGLLLVVILLFLIVQLNSTKSDLQDVSNEYASTKQLVSKLSSLKSIYGDKNKIKKALKKVLDQKSLKSANITEKSTKKGIALSSPSMSKKALDTLMSKILNGSYNVSKLKIKKLSDEKVSLDMEIKW